LWLEWVVEAIVNRALLHSDRQKQLGQSVLAAHGKQYDLPCHSKTNDIIELLSGRIGLSTSTAAACTAVFLSTHWKLLKHEQKRLNEKAQWISMVKYVVSGPGKVSEILPLSIKSAYAWMEAETRLHTFWDKCLWTIHPLWTLFLLLLQWTLWKEVNLRFHRLLAHLS
jgi:hypothetical protein